MIPKPNNSLLKKKALLKKAADLIDRSSYMVVFTGAGISTPSGIPDFRSPNTGLWKQYDPFEVASLWSFHKKPEAFFNWIKPLAMQSETAKPNLAHQAIADLESRGKVKSVITQNIDGLHQKAGSKKVLELHGSARTATCIKCGKKYDQGNFCRLIIAGDVIPRCDRCGEIIKPDVILFGEELPRDIWNDAYQECLKADLLFVVGSSLEVSPANSLPEKALHNGAKLVINNLSPTHLDRFADVLLKMDVIEGIGNLPSLLASATA